MAYQEKIGRWIVNAEARRDKAGRLAVYTLPAGDGGGRFEVAGINDRYHSAEAHELRAMIRAGKHKAAESRAVAIILDYTNGVTAWTNNPGVEAFLRDTAFNRGLGGAARVLQIAAGVKDDGRVGPVTRAAVAKLDYDPARWLKQLRQAREAYERRIAPPRGARAKFWPGLVNRWNNAEAFARTLI